MIADDPFTHDDFRTRLGKLLRLLGSDQPAEAEAARRKLLEHLTHHGVSLNDLTEHLGEVHEAGHDSFTMEALRHAEARAQRAEIARSGADAMNARLLRMGERARRQTWLAWSTTGVLAAMLAVMGLFELYNELAPHRAPLLAQQVAPRMSDAVRSGPPVPTGSASAAAAAEPPGNAHSASDWTGSVATATELLDAPDTAAQRRAMLDPGSRVLVMQSGPVWLRVRSERGDGYLLRGLVRPDR